MFEINQSYPFIHKTIYHVLTLPLLKKQKQKKAPLTHCDPITANTCHMFFGSLTLLIIKKGTKNRVIQFVRFILRKQHGGNKPKTLYVICLLTFNRQLWVISQNDHLQDHIHGWIREAKPVNHTRRVSRANYQLSSVSCKWEVKQEK